MSRQLWKPGNMLYPLPVVMLSVADKEKQDNIITVAWVGTVCTNPPIVSFSVRPSRYSHEMLVKSKECVLNITTESTVKAADYCGVKSGSEVDKFKEMNLTKIPSAHVTAPSIAESPVCIECRIRDIISLGSHDLFLADVLGVTVDEAYMNDKGKFCLEKAKPVVYSHGQYFSLGKELGSFGYSVRKKKKS